MLSTRTYPGSQFVLRLQSPQCARTATAGSFTHIQCDPDIPLRRPLSIMRANAAGGWIEVLFKVVGRGLAALAGAKAGDRLSLMGPIGHGFQPDAARPRALLVGGGVGIPPLVFLAESLAGSAGWDGEAACFFGSELPFPFEVTAATVPISDVPPAATATLSLLESWRVPGRLASGAGLAGCYPGLVTDLARHWLQSRRPAELASTTVYACGPAKMLSATQALAREFGLASQLCVEEFMACAVGGCAGCVVPVLVNGQRQMKRVCVDGPVFDGASVCIRA